MSAVAGAIFCLLLAAMTVALSLREARQRGRVQCALAVVLPVAQLVYVAVLLAVMRVYEMLPIYALAVVAAMAFSCVGDRVLVKGSLQLRSKELNAEQLRAAAEREKAAREQKALLVANAEETRRLCAEFAEELRELKGQMEGDACSFEQVGEALGMLEEKTRSRYCANETANAIIALKARACCDADVAFSFEGGVPADLAIDDLTLCSLFSNLLDNALNAASRVGAEAVADTDSGRRSDDSRFVQIGCSVQGVYLTIRVENSCAQGANENGGGISLFRRQDKNPLRRHGWGFEIVSQIAKENGGSFSLKREASGRAVAIVVLKCVKLQAQS